MIFPNLNVVGHLAVPVRAGVLLAEAGYFYCIVLLMTIVLVCHFVGQSFLLPSVNYFQMVSNQALN